jgi:membrane-associated phospholipid phosphatase
MDETLQIIGYPGTHFAAAGALWLGSALTRSEREHEVARSMGQALIVNGVTVWLLKVSADTRGPDGDDEAWPSGHTSSAFTVAAVLNEYYGPWAGVPALALAGLVGYQRLDSRTHDFSDVVFGAVMGYVVGSSIARENKAEMPEIFGMKLVPLADPTTGSTGLALMKSFK